MTKIRLAICITNKDYPVSLERRKIYQVVSDQGAESKGQIRVIDESGEDYLYPASCFVETNFPQDLVATIVHGS
jgi:hypothetical protein